MIANWLLMRTGTLLPWRYPVARTRQADLRPRVAVGNVTLDNLSMQETLAAIDDLVERRSPSYIATPNVDIIMRCNRDPEFHAYHQKSTLCVVDGTPVLWAARFLGAPLKEKVSGSDLVPALCARANSKGHRLFFLGGRQGAAE